MAERDATEVFSEWALRDRDLGMESGHSGLGGGDDLNGALQDRRALLRSI